MNHSYSRRLRLGVCWKVSVVHISLFFSFSLSLLFISLSVSIEPKTLQMTFYQHWKTTTEKLWQMIWDWRINRTFTCVSADVDFAEEERENMINVKMLKQMEIPFDECLVNLKNVSLHCFSASHQNRILSIKNMKIK